MSWRVRGMDKNQYSTKTPQMNRIPIPPYPTYLSASAQKLSLGVAHEDAIISGKDNFVSPRNISDFRQE